MLQDGIDCKTPSVDDLMAAIPEFDQDTDIATRIAGEMVLQVCCCGGVGEGGHSYLGPSVVCAKTVWRKGRLALLSFVRLSLLFLS